ncbi:MAG: hypothetical protein ABI688_08935 [Bacteroidota bacterium]
MTTFIKLIFTSAIVLQFSCNSHTIEPTRKKTPLIPKDTTIKNERDNKLFVFVGEKIEITSIPYSIGDFDKGAKARYKILQRVYGNYNQDTIEFEAYDHFGRFPFAEYNNTLLYVSEYEGKLYQEKYMYDPLFKTKDGRWAGPYSDDYGHAGNTYTKVKPEKIEFAEEVSFPASAKDENGKEYFFPFPHLIIKLPAIKQLLFTGIMCPNYSS